MSAETKCRIFEPNVFETDLDFYIQTPIVARTAANRSSTTLDEGFNFLEFLVAEDHARAYSQAKMEFSGTPAGSELYLVQTETNATIPIAVEMDPIVENGRPKGMRLTVTDVGDGTARGLPTPMRGVKPYDPNA